MSERQEATPEKAPWYEAFIEALKGTGNVSAAARIVGINRATAYRHRDTDPIFSADWDEALEESYDDLEAEARRRAFEGVREPVWYQGQQVGYMNRYSDTLLIFLLKGRRKDVFGEKIDHTSAGKEIKSFTLDLTGSSASDDE